ncbi:hypothetical protein [Moorena bouillonii]|nr:hypothetical protein [Moorena bouillonii]
METGNKKNISAKLLSLYKINCDNFLPDSRLPTPDYLDFFVLE